MKTILILGNSSAGLYDFRNELVQELLAKYRVIVSLPDEVKTGLLAAQGCEIVHTPINRRGMNPAQDLGLLRAYRALLKQYRPDLVLTYTIKPNVYGGMACAAAGVPYLATVTGLGSAFQKKGAMLAVIRGLYRAGLRRASCVFFQNEENRRIFKEGRILRGRDRLVSGSGVNLEKHPFSEYPAGEETRFLYVGRMMREKGIGEFLQAAGELASDKVCFELLGYCDEDWQEALDAAQKQGKIRQLGFDPEVQSYYERCSAVVLPTYHEGMSNVLMEASASGRPVIASDIPGCREIFEEGKTGFGCAPRSAEALTQALRKFLSLSASERAAMGRAAHEKMAAQFDRSGVVAAYREEIARIAPE
ncbi:MAG: glycosyltransferase family 4 protein [Eubacteriales bacterium]|nr:glycosyltransferase family 4 protein [Eubacteriales bacterium]